MNISKGVNYCLEYRKSNSKETTVRSWEFVLSRFERRFGDRELDSISSDEVLSFLRGCTEGSKQSTKRSHYAVLSAFFNLVKNTIDPGVENPSSTPMLRKLFRPAKIIHWTILEKEVVDEIIFRTVKPRNRLLLELMARGGMRISEVLKLRPRDVDDRKLILRDPKSGKQTEVVFIPQKVADRLKAYIEQKGIEPNQRIFGLTYQGARAVVNKAGKLVGIHLRPHDLRRHAATNASRSGTPIEIVSKVILRHANLSTTQRYLGKVSETEALRWIENVYS
jgi:integrase/recombinase XerD